MKTVGGWGRGTHKTQTNIRLCQLEQSVTQFGHLGLGPGAITQNRSQPPEGFLSWLPGEQLTRLLLAPHPFWKQMPQPKKAEGPPRTDMLWERTTLVKGKGREEGSIPSNSLRLSSLGKLGGYFQA